MKTIKLLHLNIRSSFVPALWIALVAKTEQMISLSQAIDLEGCLRQSYRLILLSGFASAKR